MKDKKDKFPCLMIHPRSGLIVRMDGKRGSNGFGEVVGTGQCSSPYYRVGTCKDTWAISNFKLFTGVINGNER